MASPANRNENYTLDNRSGRSRSTSHKTNKAVSNASIIYIRSIILHLGKHSTHTCLKPLSPHRPISPCCHSVAQASLPTLPAHSSSFTIPCPEQHAPTERHASECYRAAGRTRDGGFPWNTLKEIASPLASLPTLRILDLIGTEAGTDGVLALAAGLKHNHTLKELHLGSGHSGGKALGTLIETCNISRIWTATG